MAYDPPGYSAVDFDFTETGYSSPVHGAVDFDFGAAGLILVPVARLRLVGGQPVYLPIQATAGQIAVSGFDPVVSIPEVLQIPAGLVRTFGQVPGVGLRFAVPAAGLSIGAQVPGLAERFHVGAESIRIVTPAPFASIPEILQIPPGSLRVFPGGVPGVSSGLIVPDLSLYCAGHSPGIKERFEIPQARAVSVGGQPPGVTIGVLIPAAGLIRVVPQAVSYQGGVLTLHPAFVRIATSPQQPHYRWAIQEPETGQTVYRFMLDDLVIPVSSVQMRRRDGEPTYIAVVIPSADYDTDEAAINARSGGVMVVKRGFRFQDGREQLEEIGRVALEGIGGSKTATRGEFNLTGHKTITNNAPKTVELGGASYRNITDGKRRYRCLPDNFLQPGDTVLINGESFIVGAITYTIGTDSERMEISER